MDNRSANLDLFPRCQKRTVDVSFSGGDITSHGSGTLLLRQAEQRLGLLKNVAQSIDDPRRQKSVQHTQERMLAQRVFAIALGHEDLNDHKALRDDPALQTAVGRVDPLADSTTLGRLELRAERRWAWEFHGRSCLRVRCDHALRSLRRVRRSAGVDRGRGAAR